MKQIIFTVLAIMFSTAVALAVEVTECVENPVYAVIVLSESCNQEITPDTQLHLSLRAHPDFVRPCKVNGPGDVVVEMEESGFLMPYFAIRIAAMIMLDRVFATEGAKYVKPEEKIILEREDAIVVVMEVEVK